MARPLRVYASAATGCARREGLETEDTITLTVNWESLDSGNLGTAVYSASWIAPKSDVHSQQRFFYMGHDGELNVDQAHRGYTLASHEQGLASPNPLFMKYAPDSRGCFVGQSGYGYRSIEAFILAAAEIRSGKARAADFEGKLATVRETRLVTAILEAGRRSLDRGGRVYEIVYDEAGDVVGMK
jgi:D-galacturonate reductase